MQYMGTDEHNYENFCLFLCPYRYVCFLRFFFVVPTAEKNEEDAPVGIRTRVVASKGRHDWPLHYRSITGSSSPERIRAAVAGSKGQHD